MTDILQRRMPVGYFRASRLKIPSDQSNLVGKFLQSMQDMIPDSLSPETTWYLLLVSHLCHLFVPVQKGLSAYLHLLLRSSMQLTNQASAFVALNRPVELGELWIKITIRNLKSLSFIEKQQLSLRLRDLLMEERTLVGIPVVILSLAALAKAQEKDFESAQEHAMAVQQAIDGGKNFHESYL